MAKINEIEEIKRKIEQNKQIIEKEYDCYLNTRDVCQDDIRRLIKELVKLEND